MAVKSWRFFLWRVGLLGALGTKAKVGRAEDRRTYGRERALRILTRRTIDGAHFKVAFQPFSSILVTDGFLYARHQVIKLLSDPISERARGQHRRLQRHRSLALAHTEWVSERCTFSISRLSCLLRRSIVCAAAALPIFFCCGPQRVWRACDLHNLWPAPRICDQFAVFVLPIDTCARGLICTNQFALRLYVCSNSDLVVNSEREMLFMTLHLAAADWDLFVWLLFGIQHINISSIGVEYCNQGENHFDWLLLERWGH